MTARREEDARYRAAHPERNRGKVRKSGPKRKLSPEEARLERLRYNFRLSGDDYQRMFENQDGACAICGQRSERRLHVDHDHACCPGDRSCGKCVRGLLCGACNAALGFMRDDPERFKAAIDYLTAYAAARPPLAS